MGGQVAPAAVSDPRRPALDARAAREPIPDEPDLDAGTVLPAPGEDAATRRLESFLAEHVNGYAKTRNVPGTDTSRLSVYLKYGTLHPRTVLACLAEQPPGPGIESFRTEVAWREFYADVLFRRPESVWRPLRGELATLPTDTGPAAAERFAAWARGRTGYPIVDAGMRQLLHEGWMHNRVRMIVASFLVKDLHLPWQDGARHFLRHLVDGDLASNSGGWQWVAGTGNDSAPYFRIFNPVKQGEQHDPQGAYVRRHVRELRDVPPASIHRPWTMPGGPPNGYPLPIVDHEAERREALARYAAVRDAGRDAGRVAGRAPQAPAGTPTALAPARLRRVAAPLLSQGPTNVAPDGYPHVRPSPLPPVTGREAQGLVVARSGGAGAARQEAKGPAGLAADLVLPSARPAVDAAGHGAWHDASCPGIGRPRAQTRPCPPAGRHRAGAAGRGVRSGRRGVVRRRGSGWGPARDRGAGAGRRPRCRGVAGRADRVHVAARPASAGAPGHARATADRLDGARRRRRRSGSSCERRPGALQRG